MILTVRESEDKWFESWSKFWRQEAEKVALHGLSIRSFVDYLATRGFAGPNLQALTTLVGRSLSRYMIDTADDPVFTVSQVLLKSRK